MSQNQAYTYIIDTAANLPTNATEGVLAYAKDDNTVYAYDGSSWNSVGGSSSSGYPYNSKYHPDDVPTGDGIVFNEEFTGSAYDKTWTAHTGETGIVTPVTRGFSFGRHYIEGNTAGTGQRVSAYYGTGAIPGDSGATDYAIVAKVLKTPSFAGFATSLGVYLFDGTPGTSFTRIMLTHWQNTTTQIQRYQGGGSTSAWNAALTADSANGTNMAMGASAGTDLGHWVALYWDSANSKVHQGWSDDGISFYQPITIAASDTWSSCPTHGGYHYLVSGTTTTAGSGWLDYVRVINGGRIIGGPSDNTTPWIMQIGGAYTAP